MDLESPTYVGKILGFDFFQTKNELTGDAIMTTEFVVKMHHVDGFQLCPKCAGSGYVNPGMVSTSSQDQCPVCRGQMIISKATGLPPM